MGNMQRLFRELKFEVIKIAVFRAFLNSLIFMLIIAIIFSFLSVSIVYAVVLALIFFFMNVYLYYASVSLKKIEDANPEVREMLRTAKDTLEEDGIMIRALHQDLLKKAKKIYSGNLISYKHFMMKLGIIGVLLVATIFIATLHFDVHDIDIPLDKLRFDRRFTQLSDVTVDLNDVSLEDSDDIYGDARIAKLGNELLQLEMNPSMSELDLNNIKDAEGIGLSRQTYPVDVGEAQGAEAGGATKPEESELVNAFYLKKINK